VVAVISRSDPRYLKSQQKEELGKTALEIGPAAELNKKLFGAFKLPIPEKLTKNSQHVLAYHEAYKNAGLLDVATLMAAVKFGESSKMNLTAGFTNFSTALASLIDAENGTLSDFTQFLKVFDARNVPVVKTSFVQIHAKLLRDLADEKEGIFHDSRELLSALSSKTYADDLLTKQLFAVLVCHSLDLRVKDYELQTTSGYSERQAKIAVCRQETELNCSALRTAAEFLNLSDGELLAGFEVRKGAIIKNFRDTDLAQREMILGLLAPMALAGTKGFDFLIAEQARIVFKFSEEPKTLDDAIKIHSAMVKLGLERERLYVLAATKLKNEAHKAFLRRIETFTASELITEFTKIRRAELGLPATREDFTKAIQHRLLDTGWHGATLAPDLIQLGELIARDINGEYSPDLKKVVVKRISEHLKSPSSLTEALALSKWLLLINPTNEIETQHCIKILSEWEKSEPEKLSEETQRLQFLLGHVLEIPKLQQLPAARDSFTPEQFSFGAGFGGDTWVDEPCQKLKAEFLGQGSLRVAAGGIVEVTIGQSTLLIALPPPPQWGLESGKAFLTTPEIEEQLVKQRVRLSDRALYLHSLDSTVPEQPGKTLIEQLNDTVGVAFRYGIEFINYPTIKT